MKKTILILLIIWYIVIKIIIINHILSKRETTKDFINNLKPAGSCELPKPVCNYSFNL